MVVSQDILQWLYAAITPVYVNPILTYQDVSLVLTLFADFKVRSEHFNNSTKPIIKIYSVIDSISIYLPQSYPQEAPIIVGMINSPPILEKWKALYSLATSNDGILPRENRLLLLINELKKMAMKQDRKPPVPEKPTIPALPSTQNTQTFPPPIPSKPQQNQQSTTETSNTSSLQPTSVAQVANAAPTLPPNPIRQSLLVETSENLDKMLISILKGEIPSSLPNLKTLLQNQSKLITAYDTYMKTKEFLDTISPSIDINSSIVENKTADARNVVNKVGEYVSTEYNHQEIIVPLKYEHKQLYDLSCQEAACFDSLRFVELLFKMEKISFTDYIDNTRQLSRKRANLLIWINEIKSI